MKQFYKNKPLPNVKIATFGQAGGQIGDAFAGYRREGGARTYPVYALNSNDDDFKLLRNIPDAHQVSLKLGGLARNADEAVRLFDRDESIREKIHAFMRVVHEAPTYKEDGEDKTDLILAIAGMGGGTGTSTVVEAYQYYYESILSPVLQEEQANVAEVIFREDYETDIEYETEFLAELKGAVFNRIPRMGFILTTPRTSEGGDTQRQAYKYITQLWEASKNPLNGIAFIHAPENNHFQRKFKELAEATQNEYKSVYVWANQQIADAFHTLWTGYSTTGSEVTLDRGEIMRLLTEGYGALVFSYSEERVTGDTKSGDIVKQFRNLKGTNILQENMPLTEEVDGELRTHRYTNIGIVSIVDSVVRNISGDTVMSDIQDAVMEDMTVVGTVISGFAKGNIGVKSIALVAYKLASIPPHVDALRQSFEDVVQEVRNAKVIETHVTDVGGAINLNETSTSSILSTALAPSTNAPITGGRRRKRTGGLGATPTKSATELTARFDSMYPKQ